MGRPKQHDEQTRIALRAAAERLVAEGGPDALSVRAVADLAGTTTRAVYSVFGSKEGLVAALAQTAFELLHSEIEAQPETEDPVADLIDVGVKVFRGLVRDHPALYRIAFQRIVPGLEAGPDLIEARERTFAQLQAKVRRIQGAGLLGRKSVLDAAREVNAMMEGLSNAELRGATLPILPAGDEERAWRDALTTVIRGFAATAPQRPQRARRRAN